MEHKKSRALFPILFIFVFLIFFVISSCSTPSWFPIKKGAPHKAKLKELLDKEIVIIEGQEYIKVLNENGTQAGSSQKYLYIPIDEYLSKKDRYVLPSIAKDKEKREFTKIAQPTELKKEISIKTPVGSVSSRLKKKVMVYFDDRISSGEEILGDWISERLMNEINRRSKEVLFIDYQSVKDFLKQREILIEDIQRPDVLKLLNEVFGIHILAKGELTGPYVFTTKGGKESSASSILKIEMKLINASSGKIINTLYSTNPILSTKEYGFLSDEKAKSKAIDLCIADISRSLIEEIAKVDWFCRIARIDGEEVYINAGKLTGIKPGDVLDIFNNVQYGEKRVAKGRIEVSNLVGIDASMGRLISGEKPELEDILKLTKKE